MTFSPLPIEPAALLAHLDDHAVARHAAAALRLLDSRGVDLPGGLVDEVEEVETECAARMPSGLARNAPHLLPDAEVPCAANLNGGA